MLSYSSSLVVDVIVNVRNTVLAAAGMNHYTEKSWSNVTVRNEFTRLLKKESDGDPYHVFYGERVVMR